MDGGRPAARRTTRACGCAGSATTPRSCPSTPAGGSGGQCRWFGGWAVDIEFLLQLSWTYFWTNPGKIFPKFFPKISNANPQLRVCGMFRAGNFGVTCVGPSHCPAPLLPRGARQQQGGNRGAGHRRQGVFLTVEAGASVRFTMCGHVVTPPKYHPKSKIDHTHFFRIWVDGHDARNHFFRNRVVFAEIFDFINFCEWQS